MTPRYPHIEVQLTGQDGNVFAIIGNVAAALRRGGVPREEVQAFRDSCLQAQSYDEVLQKVLATVEVA